MNHTIAFLDCTATLSGNALTVRNSKIGRTWLVTDAGLVPQSLTDMISGETVTEKNEEDISPVLLSDDETAGKLSLEGGEDDDCGFGKNSLKCCLTAVYPNIRLKFEIFVYPSVPILRTRMFISGSGRPSLKESPLLDTLVVREKHCEWENISLRAVTDSHNNLVRTDQGLFYLNESAKLSGNLLRVHRTLRNDGLVLIKESPAADEQVRYEGFDFSVSGKRLAVHSAGFSDRDLLTDEFVPLYGSAVGLYHGGDLAFYRLLRDYHEARHVFRKDDGGVFSNTWGDDSGGRKISEKFIQEELDAAHEIGITHYQVDAGWDTGEKDPATGRSRWNLNCSVLPYGFDRIREKMDKYGMTLGLWFEPYTDDGNDYACYQQDAETLAGLHRSYGAVFFKMDGFQLLSFTATYRFEKMMRLVLAETGGSVFFDMDVTNWPRTGFFGATQYSNLFFENRYTDRLSYYPHCTLRNLWLASRYFPTYRMQTEFLNVGRNASLYDKDEEGDALAPFRCGEDYAAATTLFASPLAWLEPSMLEEGNKNLVKRLLKTTENVRKDILSSHVLPIGDVPNGTHFTGFQAMRDGQSGYLLFLKEAGGEGTYQYRLYTKGFDSDTVLTKIISNCADAVSVVSESEVSVTMDRNFSFAVYGYRLLRK